jgi:transcription elongation factor GreA
MTEASYLTQEGLIRLQQELEFLKGPSREQLSQRLRAAIEQGDLSENADYAAAKEEQGFLEGRILELEHLLSNVIIIDNVAKNVNEIGIGDYITLQEEDYPSERYHLVGPKEADPNKGRISHESPIGKAIIGHKVGDEVIVDTPGGSVHLKILKSGGDFHRFLISCWNRTSMLSATRPVRGSAFRSSYPPAERRRPG